MAEVQSALLISTHVVQVECEPSDRAGVTGASGISVSICDDEVTLTVIHRDGTMLCALLSEEQLDAVCHQLAATVEHGNAALRRRVLQ